MNPQAVCMGEILIDFVAAASGQILKDAPAFERKPGGAPANVAVGLVRLGCAAAFAGMVGRDAFGDFLRETLETENVDTRSLATCPDQPTTLAFVSLTREGVPSFSFYRHPNADLSIRPEDVDPALFDSARVFHFGSLSLVASPAADTTFYCLEKAREKDCFVTYDPNYRPALWPQAEAAKARMADPLGQIDLIKVSEEELAFLTGEDRIERGCEVIAAKGPRYLAVTRGANGMYGWHVGEHIEIAAQPVEVVDTTGCGDASMAGIIAYLLDNATELCAGAEIPIEVFAKALDYGNRCAAIAATQRGAIPSLPHKRDILTA